jgi:hypothetical protein
MVEPIEKQQLQNVIGLDPIISSPDNTKFMSFRSGLSNVGENT